MGVAFQRATSVIVAFRPQGTVGFCASHHFLLFVFSNADTIGVRSDLARIKGNESCDGGWGSEGGHRSQKKKI